MGVAGRGRLLMRGVVIVAVEDRVHIGHAMVSPAPLVHTEGPGVAGPSDGRVGGIPPLLLDGERLEAALLSRDA